MKAHKKRIRSLAIAACALGLAAPAGAAAMPLGPHAVRVVAHSVPVAPDESGARLDHRGLKDGGGSPFSLPAGFKTDAQTPSSSPSSTPASVITEIRTVVHDASRTLPIVLAACALGIALCGSGFAAYRLARIQRRLAASGS
jgi:hypothetical protein